ncbi:hypothetical protein NJD71_05525 [Psychrobacter sp. PP-21]|uniref:hypothetical protein n=1 Tax=Psychrobacter sp. PP-21 TaxID=2957503 RepID=UPI0029B79081|nr:hypothetical protein [Psychrobacter sp. PP-21]MDX2373586.1 hypothetical protein [Psychrobacter sp. PP-21]
MTCTFEGCTNNKFAPHEECALHCVKGNYQNDSRKSVLSEFYNLLRIYIADFLAANQASNSHNNQSLFNSSSSPYKRGLGINFSQIFRDGDLDNDENRNLIRRTNTNDLIVLHNISFPDRRSKDSFDYFKLLKLFSGIHLLDCHLYIGDWQLEDVSFFFQGCMFYNQFDITPFRMLSNDTNCLFSECDFKDKVRVSPTEINSIFEDSLFSGCRFSNLIDLSGVGFKSEPFLELNDKLFVNTELKIFNCTFEGVVKLNKVALSSLWINDTNFLSNFEILNTEVGKFVCTNTEMHGVFKASESHFSYARFERVKFHDVADFEKAAFGEANKIVIASYPVTTIFRFATFMTASNFKKVNFYYGLDFENVDLREQPNFLKSNINPHNTNRETFRIIKYSFDSRGNTLEANRFFVQEMKAFKNELKEEGGFWDKLVYNVNDLISEFGRNYIRAITWLIISLISYTILLYLHDWYFDNFDYFIWKKLEWIWIFLNDIAKNFLPFSRFLGSKSGFEFISLLFYIWFGILIWQIVVSVKRHTQR